MSANPRDFSFCVAVVHKPQIWTESKLNEDDLCRRKCLIISLNLQLSFVLTIWRLYVHLYTYNHDRVMYWIEDFFSFWSRKWKKWFENNCSSYFQLLTYSRLFPIWQHFDVWCSFWCKQRICVLLKSGLRVFHLLGLPWCHDLHTASDSRLISIQDVVGDSTITHLFSLNMWLYTTLHLITSCY